MSVTPISPAEAKEKCSLKTDKIVEAFNILICDEYNGIEAVFSKDQVVDVLSRTTGLDKKWIKSRNLNYQTTIEQFRGQGWKVSYSGEVFTLSA